MILVKITKEKSGAKDALWSDKDGHTAQTLSLNQYFFFFFVIFIIGLHYRKITNINSSIMSSTRIMKIILQRATQPNFMIINLFFQKQLTFNTKNSKEKCKQKKK